MIKIWLVMAGIVGGVVLTSLAPSLIGSLRSQVAGLPGMAWLMGEAIQASAASDAERHDHHHEERAIKLSDQQIAAAGIEVEQAKAAGFPRCGSGKSR